MIGLFHIGFLNFSWIDVIDILLVSMLLYHLYKLLKGSVAVRIFIGLSFIYLFYLVINAAGMELLGSILGQFIGVGVIASVILFQQEIRKFLLLIGNTTNIDNQRLINIFKLQKQKEHIDVNSIVKAAEELANTKTGALIVIPKSTDLQQYIDSGDLIDAVLSKRLLITIFNKYSPMHDGAVIVTHGRVKAARCIIPVSENQNLPAQYGLRHRASIGLTEVADCAVVVVSEETGKMSLSYDGELFYNLSSVEMRSNLNRLLHEETEEETKS